MPTNLVPKVSITELAETLAVPQANQVVIGIIGTSEKGTANTVKKISSVSEAESIFGANTAYGANLVSMIKKAFQEGASVIKAVSIGSPSLDASTSASQGALTADSLAGATTLTVADATVYSAGDVIYLGTGNTFAEEERVVVSTGIGSTITLSTALKFTHYTGELAKIVNEKVDADYTNAINAMGEDEDKNLVVIERNTDAVAAAVLTMCDNSTSQFNAPCVYVRGGVSGETATTAATKATSTNNDRCIFVFPFLVEFNGKVISGGETAAALAGVIAGNGLPKLNHNFSEFTGFGGVSEKIADMDALLSAGVTPIQLKYNTIHIVRLLTTKTETMGVPDATWIEGAVRLNVDVIQKTIAREIQRGYLQKGNTPTVRASIREKCKSILDIFAGNNILVEDERTKTPAYRDPVVTTDANDNSKVNVDIAIAPGKPLNFISLNFKVFI